jgi:hypothetical protein
VWNKFFRKLARAIVIGAVGNNNRQPIGSVPGSCQMIGCGFAGRVGRAG